MIDNLRAAAVFGTRMGKSPKDNNFERILELTDLQGQANTITQNLTTLSLKKLEVARAMACDPDLILLDEVAAGLTEKEIPRALNMISEIRSTGKTVILVEHVMKVLVNAVDRIVVLDKGKVLCQGCTDDVMNDCKVIEAYFGE